MTLKTFDPAIDGGFQDECDCDRESSLNCQGIPEVCECACHVELHEHRIKEVEELRKRLEEAEAGAVHLWNTLQAITEDGTADCEWCKAHEKMASRACERNNTGQAALAVIEAARDKVGPWISAALEDPKVCEEMKADIRGYFEAANTWDKATGA